MTEISQHILQRVAQFIDREQLFPVLDGACLYVGLSGGPDSVAVLHILLSLGYKCTALHCNFNLRGEESDRDQSFCLSLCRDLGVPIEVKSFDTHAYMKSHNLSLEMAARTLRYDWWKSYTKRGGLIALGHHQDDSVETLLMNLMRGTGIQGLTGIVSRNEATHVVRPLLCLSRQDVISYLRDNQLQYVTDSTNAENDTLRNQIRNRLLPLMEEILPQSRQGIATTMQHLQSTEALAECQMTAFDHLTKHHNQWGIEWDELQIDELSVALREVFPDADQESLLETFLHRWTQQRLHDKGKHVKREGQYIFSTPNDDSVFDSCHPLLEISQLTSETSNLLRKEAQSCTRLCFQQSRKHLTESFDASTVVLPIQMRRWREGDRMAPLGMNGHTKLLSDLFQNAHYSPMQKATTWLVTDATGAILWVIGLRISHLHRVTTETQEILQITAGYQ